MATFTKKLAQPKPNRLRYPDRRSVYWLDQMPPESTGSITKIELTPHWSELCRNKTFYSQVTVFPLPSFPFLFLFYVLSTSFLTFCILIYPRSHYSLPFLRISPEWAVSGAALRAVPSDRLCALALPPTPAVGWQPERPLLSPLNRGTQTAVATSRICQLAQPKRRPVLEGCSPKSKLLPLTHIPYKASAHIELLATPKHDHPKFEGQRSVCWPVSRAARNCSASHRLLELCGPKRKALFEGYDPNIVSRAARSASPSPRIQQLCLPLPRKCASN
ncbi:LOW QUALITY PROTEIN: theg spermatid protein [Trematomus bernacchii]|uniref:LOW QUALITY PROTEIN: theg spermatid protein n=1 Tax=Trematomus bernacchii TaxID=40690 RepID=UPI00146B62CC|nr:LOW QUALITY PROTEIN: theg spermatid protein [Trematomus bernacchii]